jgi:hypothetical protein
MGMWNVDGLPDPSDHSVADWNGEPAYLAWYRRLSSETDVSAIYRAIVDYRLERRYAWAVPNSEALEAVLELGPIVEIGAGGGYWARLLRDRGGEVIAYEPAPLDEVWTDMAEPWTPLLRGGVDDAAKHPDRALFVGWPPRPNGFMVDLLLEAPQRTLALITDGRGPVQDRMYDLLEREWTRTSEVAIPTWPSRSDRLMTWSKTARRPSVTARGAASPHTPRDAASQ